MRLHQLSRTDFAPLFERINVDKSGQKILSEKFEHLYFEVQNLKVVAANILKQELLSLGCDLATPRGTIIHETPAVDCYFYANVKQLRKLITKLKIQPFGLKKLAEQLQTQLPRKSFKRQIMGILNLNEDSFYSQSRTNVHQALKQIQTLINQGAHMVDVGAVSSRPGSLYCGKEEEQRRLKTLFSTLKNSVLSQKTLLSLDSFDSSVCENGINAGFKIINDITGAKDERLRRLVAHTGVKIVIMHMQNQPHNMQKNPQYTNIIEEVCTFFEHQIEACLQSGIAEKKIILDVGIGFGKTHAHNLELLHKLSTFKQFGVPLLVGASRKSICEKITGAKIHQRLASTLALHQVAWQNGADIIRCHDVFEHHEMLKVLQVLE